MRRELSPSFSRIEVVLTVLLYFWLEAIVAVQASGRNLPVRFELGVDKRCAMSGVVFTVAHGRQVEMAVEGFREVNPGGGPTVSPRPYNRQGD